LSPITVDDVSRIIVGLKNCAAGIDLISTKILKRYAPILIPAITHICNLAIDTGVFPSTFKAAVIKPIFKTGESNVVSNFRPIAILPTLSKILERLLNQQLIKFLETKKLLSPSQYGFRRSKSTDDAIHELVDYIMTALDGKKKCLTIFLDLAKAFDTVSIPRLLLKLEKIGVRGVPLELFTSYLTGRSQKVRIGNYTSDSTSVTIGVPQGSILGPTLFLVYINDLCTLKLNEGKIVTFADDTALLFTGETWRDVFDYAQKGFNKVKEWLAHNVLTLNVSKTKYIPFALKSSRLPSSNYFLTAHECATGVFPCLCPAVQRTEEIKYLGIVLDQSLTFKPHIDSLVPKLRKLIFIFKTLKHVADRNILKMVYYALCQSIAGYCITVWGGAAKSHLIQAERAQRAILKVAAGLPFRHPTHELYTSWNLLTIRQIFIQNTILRQQSLLYYDPELHNKKRRKHKVCATRRFNTATSQKLFGFLSAHLYNKLNKILNIYPLTRFACKLTMFNYLKSLDYQATENLIKID
jgi:hypothetical protein